MYHAVIRQRARGAFDRLSAGDWRPLLADFADDVHHVFPGDNALGGERHSRQAVASWFERLDRLFPHHEFDVRQVVSRGWPWGTWVTVQWTGRLTPREGEPYVNEGTHWIHVRWGKVTYFHAYLDTQLVTAACRDMAARGIDEAVAPPIGD